jgi:hypothetical protein
MGSGISPVSMSNFAVIGTPLDTHYSLSVASLIVYSAQIYDRREPYARSEMMPVHDSGGGWPVMHSSTLHCPLSTVHCPGFSNTHGIGMTTKYVYLGQMLLIKCM